MSDQLIAIILFGYKGFVVLVLLAAQPFIGKKKADERDTIREILARACYCSISCVTWCFRIDYF